MGGVPGDSLRIMADSLRPFLLGLRVRPQAPVTECCDASLSGARKYSSANSCARLRGLIIRHKFSIPIHVRYVPRAAVEPPGVMKVRKECFLGFDAIRSYQGLSPG